MIWWCVWQVNNAGVAYGGLIDCMGLDAFRKTMEVNFFSMVALTQVEGGSRGGGEVAVAVAVVVAWGGRKRRKRTEPRFSQVEIL